MANVELNEELTRLGVVRFKDLEAPQAASTVGAVLPDGKDGTTQGALDALKKRADDVSQNLDTAVNDINKQMSQIGSPTFAETPAASVVQLNVLEVAVVRLMLTADITTIQLSGIPIGAGLSRQVTLILNQGIGSRKVAWPESIIWSRKREPTLSFAAGAEDMITLLACGTDSTLYGFFSGVSFGA